MMRNILILAVEVSAFNPRTLDSELDRYQSLGLA